MQTFINSRFEQIEKRFGEIQLILDLASSSRGNIDLYQALCRSAHVLLVGHFEGLYKEICRDVIDDINANTSFYQVKNVIFSTHCSYYIHSKESEGSFKLIRDKLFEALKSYPSKLIVDPFLFFDNKNPTPDILETILKKFGVKNFFKVIEGSDLDIVFEDEKTKVIKLRDRLLNYVKKGTVTYPYKLDPSIYHPSENVSKSKITLWESFINNFLKERHNIIHGNTLNWINRFKLTPLRHFKKPPFAELI